MLTYAERQERDKKNGWLDYIFLSLVSEGARVSRQLLPVRVFHGANRKMSTKYEGIRLIVTENSTWPKATRRHLKKVVLAAENVGLPAIIARLSDEVYGNVLAAQLILGERSERWVDPTVAETFSRMVEARVCVNQCDGNDSARRFWKKLEMLYESDVGLSFDALANELKHFEKEIPLWA